MSCLRIFVTELHSLEWVGIVLARIGVGLLFFLSGRGKLFVPERRDQMRQTLIIQQALPLIAARAWGFPHLVIATRVVKQKATQTVCLT